MIRAYKNYLNGRYYFSNPMKIAILLAIWVISGFLGFVYESVFYFANSGFQTFFWRTGTFGPWIESYSIIAIILLLVLYRIRKMPWFVFLIGTVGGTLLKFLAGLGLYYFCNGTRAWNYNLEILNFGNIGGFVCLRTLIEFAVITVLTMYVVAPLVCMWARSVQGDSFQKVWYIIGAVSIIDILYNDVISPLTSLPGAYNVYTLIGLKFMTF